MKGTKFLSELVNCSTLQKDQLNIIKAPTGSGKSYFALHHIPSLTEDAVHNVVYLIDTINGKEQIIRNYNAISEYHGWSQEVEKDGIWFDPNNKVVVITYAKFGYLFTKYTDFYKKFSYIICDELHSLLNFEKFSKQPNVHSLARMALELAVKDSPATVIALTATPDRVYKGFNAPAIEIAIDQSELKQYEVKETIGYTNLSSVLDKVDIGSIGLCYISRIHAMIDFENVAKEMGFSPICIWSINNTDHRMNEQQLEARRSILEEWTIPPQYDLLIINSSSETSLKIKSHVDYVIVNSSNPDTQIQVRGRINSDLQTLYLPTNDVPTINVPSEFLGKRLFRDEKQKLIDKLNLRNPANNRPYGWTTIRNVLIDNDYNITDGRSGNKRYVIIEPAHDGQILPFLYISLWIYTILAFLFFGLNRLNPPAKSPYYIE